MVCVYVSVYVCLQFFTNKVSVLLSQMMFINIHYHLILHVNS